MAVTASTVSVDLGYDLAGYDVELRYEWGPWTYRNARGLDLGYPKTNVLHKNHGLGGSSAPDDPMTQMVYDVDAIVRQLPRVMQVAAKEWWVYNQCVSKRAVCRDMTDWYKRQGVIKKVQPRDLDVWINAVAMAVFIGLNGKR